MECVIYSEQGFESEQVDCGQAADGGRRAVLDRVAELKPREFAWVHLDEPGRPDLEDLADHLGLHPLAVEDAVQAHQRPKRERYGDVLAVALKTLWYVEGSADVETGEVMVFVGPRFVLTVRHGPVDPTEETVRRLRNDPVTVGLGPVSVLHCVLDVVVDAYMRAAVQVRSDLTELERCVFSSARDDVTEEIYSLKREVVEFRDAVQPLVPVVQEFAADATNGRKASCRTSGMWPTTRSAPIPRSAPWTSC